MIQPINQNLNINSNSSLKPVEVPHFTGLTKVTKKENKDSFVKSTEKIKDTAKKTAKKTGDFAVTFKKNAAETLDAAKDGAIEGAKVVKNAAQKGAEFTVSFAKSLYEDLSGVIREKGTKAITNIDGLI